MTHRHANASGSLRRVLGVGLWLAAAPLACGTERIELGLGPLETTPESPDADGEVSRGGCQMIDFLFVVDNSLSMLDEQIRLARSFPGFVQVLEQVVEADDFHVMVVSTSGQSEDEESPTLDPDACDAIQGAGKRRSPGGTDCNIQGGLAYMTQEQTDLEGTFSCAAQVGIGGSFFEEPMDALIAATGQNLNAPGRCNDGFLRDEAILVATIITDEEDESDGTPEQWRSDLLAAKGGNPDALVVLGLVGDNNVEGGLLDGPCIGFDDGAPRLQQFVGSLDGVLGSVCAPDYTPFFQAAVDTIDSACTNFVPPVLQ